MRILTTLFFLSVSVSGMSQLYIKMAGSPPTQVYKLTADTLFLEYFDKFGNKNASTWNLSLVDNTGTTIKTYALQKFSGLNHYKLLLPAMNYGEIYTGEMVDERNQKHSIHLLPQPVPADMTIGIMINPIESGCDGLTAPMIEYYGDVKGGTAPYDVTWFVLNGPRTDLLFQPRKAMLAYTGQTPTIQVDQRPEYNVVLYVKDACGREQKKVVSLGCDMRKKKINTVFVEELKEPIFNRLFKIQ